ncbi:Uu.00g010530.m01.CDS01 [Anthostomella pinea]|uniref:Uu.00g010530.m01.CDS01 n=1 Tax=Anthostomella pinea TaxID=933095 RepID=A0AAI8YPY5_9PEZI|nr:Uu.00g010530.m01.CDS01 [Anthostomella pinea]
MEEKHWTTQYIPAGCIVIRADGNEKAPELLPPDVTGSWRLFAHPRDDLPPSSCLSAGTQQALLGSHTLKPFRDLWQHRYVHLSFSSIPQSDSQIIGRARVYVLPHDVNGGIKNVRPELIKASSLLLSCLEYASGCWDGHTSFTHQSHPTDQVGAALSDGKDTSLLAMFNNVTSPDPHPEAVADPYARDAMQGLLESQISGLSTSLYPYQGRSAALMLQRELEPGRIVDPRFRSVLDQSGCPWYYDDVSGMVLREPRYYDGLRGGILAEEMGTGKTLTCLALILSTRNEPTTPPEPFIPETSPRKRMGSLMDMAAAAVNKHSLPWKSYFESCKAQFNYDYQHCTQVLLQAENRAFYKVSNNLVEPRRSNRTAPRVVPPKEVFLSHTTLIIVPNNLVRQWQEEMKKHTTGLNVIVLVEKAPIPSLTVLLGYDVILFSETRFERLAMERSNGEGPAIDTYCPLEYVHFKRCIIDEGHKLGNRTRSWRSAVMMVLDRLEISARWVVTGTPSRGLYGVHQHAIAAKDTSRKGDAQDTSEVKLKQEKDDLQRIGNLAAKYLKVRPWANTKNEVGDSVADWNLYVLHPKQHAKGHDRKDCLAATLNSLIVRHRLPDVSDLLPPVNDKIVLLDGSFQDQLSLNLFSMMIIFNSVQSQRTDMDYFFHERQRKSLNQLVRNLKQASFFGGVFWSTEEITKSLETAESFLEKKAIPISAEDEDLLKRALEFGKMAVSNRLKAVSNQFHAMPLYLQSFPGGNGKSWSLDDNEAEGGLICTDAGMIHSLQKFLNPCIDAPTSLRIMIENGRLDRQGVSERSQALAAAIEASGGTTSQNPQATSLAGNTPLGNDRQAKPKSTPIIIEEDEQLGAAATSNIEIAEPLARTQIISSVSAKLSYLIDSIIKYQDEEQILVFYENDNIAYYLAGVLEILQVQHLIYTKAGLSPERRAKYVTTFTHNAKFRVMLMDISQAAFGLDMRSASRVYFITPVLNPQVEAQAIGRARRISQKKPVTVETLVLRNSIEEIIVIRRKHMTQAEHSKVKDVLDDRKIFEWILNAKIIPMPDIEDGVPQTTRLAIPQYVFGRGFGRDLHPDEGLLADSPEGKKKVSTTQTNGAIRKSFKLVKGLKRPHSPSPAAATASENAADGAEASARPTKRRTRIAWVE